MAEAKKIQAALDATVVAEMMGWALDVQAEVSTTGGSCLSRIFWEHENLSDL